MEFSDLVHASRPVAYGLLVRTGQVARTVHPWSGPLRVALLRSYKEP